MSTVLERMIQRTRAPLSSLEPLSRPHFAPAGPAQRLWADSADEVTEAAPDESAGSGQYPRPGARPERPREEPAHIHRADRSANSAAAPWPGEAEPLAAAPQPGPRLELRSAAARNRTPDGDQTQPEPAASPDPGQTGPEQAAAGRLISDVRQTQPQPTAAHPDAGQAQPEPAATPAPRAGRGASRDALGPGIEEPTAPATAEPGAGPAVRPVTVAARLLPAAPRTQAREGSGRSPVPGESAAGDGDGRPAVTISIGHVEVRAAPPAERPRTRPPFRPRVSLDDFLGQQRDSQR
ncbi:MAG TPA: hypothetical protein VHN16_17095 [Streptosporangiaceae bacterium]|nr:hypothetical protein [Streptosporangiaceae bacterium]